MARKARRKAARRATRKARKARKRPVPLTGVRVERRTLWRDPRTGRAAKRPERGRRYPKGTRPRPETRLVQIDAKGRVLRTLELLTRRRVIKTSLAASSGSVDQPFMPRSRGMIFDALATTNILTRLNGAKRITVLVRGRDPHGKLVKVTRVIHTFGIKNLTALLITSVVGAMREKGYRTQYTLDQVDWTKVRPVNRPWHGRTINTKSFLRTLQPLHDVEIQVILEK